ncbi:MAG: DUF4397 domain-containing protein [Clostridiales bacterium]|nr:DUF4397 domain-containing protein [Clostridiales bacterium]
MDFFIDGSGYANGFPFGMISGYSLVSDGFHTVTARQSSGMRTTLLQQTLPFSSGQKYTLVLTDSASGELSFIQVSDTGCANLPANTGCYHLANMSYSGSVYDLLTANGSTAFRNIAFQGVSAYKQTVAGSYSFTVTNAISFSAVQELSVIVNSAVTAITGYREPVLGYSVDINAGKNYTTYLIGNTWSGYSLRAVTVGD